MSLESSAGMIVETGSTRQPAMRLRNISELRLIFAGSVVLSHAASLLGGDSQYWLRVILNSEAAVQGFFILSGYLVCGSYDRLRSPRAFYTRRLLRLYPAYAVAVLLFITLGIAQALWLGNRVHWAELPSYLAANLTTLNFLKHDVGGVFAANPIDVVNGALWSIKVELMFYASLPLLFWIGRRASFLALSAALIIAGVLWWPVLNWAGAMWGIVPPLSFKFQLPGQIHFFALGMALFARSRGYIALPALIALIAGALVLLAFLGEGREAANAFILVMLIAIVSAMPQIPDIFRGQDISYGIYLCHFPLIQLLIAAGAGQLPFPLYLGIVVVLSILYGLASWRWIERRALAGKKPASPLPAVN